MSNTIKTVLILTFILFSLLTISTFLLLGDYANKIKKTRQSVYVAPFNNKKQKAQYQFTSVEDSIAYEKVMIEFFALQSMATAIFPVDTTLAKKEKSLSDLKDIGIYYWDRDLELLDSVKKLDLPNPLIKKTALFKEYCHLNKDCYTLMYKAINEHTKIYDERIHDYFKEIEEKRKLIATY